jgi:hypothetical protein
MISKGLRLTMLVALAGSLLAGCTGAAAPSVPTIDVKPTMDAVSTMAVATVVAQSTKDAPAVNAQPTVDINAVSTMAVETAVAQFTKDAPAALVVEQAATAVPPTATVVVVPPTATLVPPAPASGVVATAVPPTCSIVERSPAPATQFAAYEDFDGIWVVKNTSGKVWHSQETDIKFMYGNKVHLGADVMDLASDLQSGDKVTITIDMKAPSTSGHYSSVWGVYSVGNLVCTLSVYFDVK